MIIPTRAKIFNLRFNSAIDAQITLVDIIGKEIYSSNVNSKENVILDLSAKPNGMYYLKVQVGKDILTKKIILNK